MVSQFTQNQKAAVVALLLEMVNADDALAYEELIVTNDIWARIGVDEETYNLGRTLKYEYAVCVLRTLEKECKVEVAQLLVEVVDADDIVDDRELHLLKKICDDINVAYVFEK